MTFGVTIVTQDIVHVDRLVALASSVAMIVTIAADDDALVRTFGSFVALFQTIAARQVCLGYALR